MVKSGLQLHEESLPELRRWSADLGREVEQGFQDSVSNFDCFDLQIVFGVAGLCCNFVRFARFNW